ncbi:hypothetical protein [Aurantiacibacter poecillastricola]|uniref:hypothetical protein n=1 Tax=Aurantiacibacter poecillastricola TaxID=3064385 RepID=UPI00273FD066|nr:hypothetical protein [Aurantiacibacter sp. 219JJ12-13]MDP5262978.1 hypothetical protein [Aurantiacibacter sp. 219JJ12-13]
MDGNLAMIFWFILAAMMIVFPCAYMVNKRVQEHEERKLELEARIEEAKAQQLRDERKADTLLEDRVRVLERIATDRSPDLAAEIEDLRRESAA